jgi:ubiquinone/menaquinone biosynthesis C-methylase UbiE
MNLTPSKIIKKTNSLFRKSSSWFKIATLLILLLFIFVAFNLIFTRKEGFQQLKKFVLKQNSELYDDFYCEIYDELMYDPAKNIFELDEIKLLTNLKKTSSILDVGSGTGHHAKSLSKNNYNVIGLDKSESMVKYSSKKYPEIDFITGDAINQNLFQGSQFTHVTCLYFTIYYLEDKFTFFKNCMHWLKPGGSLILHLVDRNNFNPIVNAGDPLTLVSAQKYAKERITNSIVKFKDFQYKANFKLNTDTNIAIFDETLKDDSTGHVRQNEHTLYMDTQKNILSLAKSAGLILKGNVNMVSCNYAYQYLYILTKPE